MSYNLKIIAKAQKDLDGIRGKDFSLIKKKIMGLAQNPRPFGCSKLTIEEGHRIRIRGFRILYRIDDRLKEIIIYRIKYRREVYR